MYVERVVDRILHSDHYPVHNSLLLTSMVQVFGFLLPPLLTEEVIEAMNSKGMRAYPICLGPTRQSEADA